MAATGVVTVEGLIGAGKSSVKEALEVACAADGLDVVFVDEPVDTWAEFVDGDGVGILELFYQNQSRWAFSFQMMAYISRLERLATARRENPGKLIVAERSLAADHRTFAKMLHDSGDIGDIEFKIYQKWFSTFAARLLWRSRWNALRGGHAAARRPWTRTTYASSTGTRPNGWRTLEAPR
jgi:deoxyadenosine/deoxycytidine kinase